MFLILQNSPTSSLVIGQSGGRRLCQAVDPPVEEGQDGVTWACFGKGPRGDAGRVNKGLVPISNRIHVTGIFSYMNGGFLRFSCR